MQPTPKVRTIKGSPYWSVENLLRRLESPVQKIEVDPGRKTTIIGANGTRLTIYPSSFIDHLDRVVEAPVELQLRESFSRKDLLLSNKMTTSEDRLMESAGQLWLMATCQGAVVDLVYPISVELPVKKSLYNPISVRLYSGSTAYTRGFYPEDLFDWRLVDKKPLRIRRQAGRKYFRFWLYQFNWINCQNEISPRSGRNMVSAKPVSSVPAFDDLMAFLVLSDTHSMARMLHTNGHYTAFNIPGRHIAKVVMIGYHEGTAYLGVKSIPKTNNCQVYVQMQALSETELALALDKL